LCDHRIDAILPVVADVELHDEIVEWMDSLDDDEWDRSVVVIDRLVALGSAARMPLSRSLGEGLFELRFTLGPTARRITYRFTKDSTQQRTSRDRPGPQVADDCARTNP
jgi:putative component of toxin-antitoxin plasmid stabilization module